MTGIVFPPLLTGLAVAEDPFEASVKAVDTVDPGSVFYGMDEATLRAAVVLAPEKPLAQAIGVSFAIALGMNDAIGVLSPPEVAFHFEWPGTFRVNGALCGGIRARASTTSMEDEPDWLVIGIDVPVIDAQAAEPGLSPDQTTLYAEGCGEIIVPDLIEAWARHMMNWLHIYLTDGFEPLHEEWRLRAYKLGEYVDHPEAGTFVGLDEWGGMILNAAGKTRILPLTLLLDNQ